MPETWWDKTKSYSSSAYTNVLKPGFDKVYVQVDKLGKPINRLTNKLGAEAFWPTTLDKESDKAARILRAFCKDGFYTQVDEQQAEVAAKTGEAVEGPKGKQRVVKKIPKEVIQQCRGLAIFTVMRTGLWFSGAGGSGIVIAKNRETGEWSPPSGIILHVAALGFLVGVDIYDCVVVINTDRALDAFTKVRCTLGGELSVAAGPVGMGGVLDSEMHKRQAPIWTYQKSKGFYAGVQVDGTIIVERTDENEKFYREKIGVTDILAGKARYPPTEQYRMLHATIKAAQGEEVDSSLLPDAGVSPSDFDIVEGSFGIPDAEDPDPYGVKALEAEGLHIREAGTHHRPRAEAFEFRPAPTSPIYNSFRRSVDSGTMQNKANGWRGSTQSLASITRGTQTEEDEPKSFTESPRMGSDRNDSPPMKETEHLGQTEDENEHDHRDSISDVDSEAEIETAVPIVTRARMVSVPKRVPPALPPRNPGRMSSPLAEQAPIDGFDSISLDEPSAEANHTHDLSDHKISTNVSTNNDEDEFKSMPATPNDEKGHVFD